jgi:hypothetical protein
MKYIALHNAEQNTKYSNLALLKLAAYHKEKGDTVESYAPLFSDKYDKIYSSKVFTFKKTERPTGNVEFGGTGYNLTNTLPDEIEHLCPDYALHPFNYSLGFLTRGCPNNCAWCIVPKKEGAIRAHADIDEFLRHKNVVLMDNNVLASPHGITQIEKLGHLGVKVDFNQGLDARLIDDSIARRLAKLKWLSPIRLACDTNTQMKYILNAVQLLRWHNARPARYFVYCLMRGTPEETIDRVQYLKRLYLEPFVQPLISFDSIDIRTKEQRLFARWVNHTAVFNSVSWDDYKNKKETDVKDGFFSQQYVREHFKINS